MRRQNLKELWGKLKEETLSRNNPHQIALGVGVGTFLGILPLQGFKSVLVVVIGGMCKKVNIIAVFTASTAFSLIPVVPFVYFLDYWVGTKILGMPVIFTASSFKNFSVKMLGGSVGALFLGAVFVGISLGILSYFASLFVMKKKHDRGGGGCF
jgi:uncharacterized protein (DUF2062 family)